MIDYKNIIQQRDQQLQNRLWELSRDFLAGIAVCAMFGFIIAGFVS